MEWLNKTYAFVSGHLDVIFGSSLSMYFSKDTQTYSVARKLFLLFAGVWVGHKAGGAIIEICDFAIVSYKADMIRILCALYGMSLLAQVQSQLQIQVPKWIDAARRKLLGGD